MFFLCRHLLIIDTFLSLSFPVVEAILFIMYKGSFVQFSGLFSIGIVRIQRFAAYSANIGHGTEHNLLFVGF